MRREGKRLMEAETRVLQYLRETYQPEAILVYGSYAEGSAGRFSDFDALVIAPFPRTHDTTRIGDTPLDVFVYPPETFEGPYDPEEFVQVFDAKILMDANGLGGRLKKRVLEYLDKLPAKDVDALREEMAWCRKMLERTAREDVEGNFRWHWLLCDSLEIYCEVRAWHYFGPKKSLRRMEKEAPEAYALYARALRDFSQEALADWIGYLTEVYESIALEGKERKLT
ncbi:MAG: nucleotidyltransferase domain-containing protein [Clostridia bacterium]|nr:nucleotidyltransferase domain-containing protein [Clostridia bacterium]